MVTQSTSLAVNTPDGAAMIGLAFRGVDETNENASKAIHVFSTVIKVNLSVVVNLFLFESTFPYRQRAFIASHQLSFEL